MSVTIKILSLVILASVLSASPAIAQIGGLTGSVGGNLDTNVRTEISRPDVSVPAKARIKTGSTRSHSGVHYHGSYAHNHGGYGYDHYHNDRYSHTHGYASLTVKINADQDRADVGPYLTYGQKVESRKGKYLGRIISMSRTETGRVTSITVDGVPASIPVDTLRVEDDLLVTSLRKKNLKG